MTIEIVTLGFPIYQIFKHKRNVRETNRTLAEFDKKRLSYLDDSPASGSVKTGSAASKRGKLYPMESLDEALAGNHDGLQVYASCMELNGENIIFLTKVLAFKKACYHAFYQVSKSTPNYERARTSMFRLALSIFVSLVHAGTASYPINIESIIYNRLDLMFGPATALVAIKKTGRSGSQGSSNVTPWDDQSENEDTGAQDDDTSIAMHAIGGDSLSETISRSMKGSESSEHIVIVGSSEIEAPAGGASTDPLDKVQVPAEFNESVFDAAFKSIRYMVWTETWQRYQSWKKGSGVARDA